MSPQTDSMTVRSGEELDRVALDEYLRHHLSVVSFDSSAALELEQFPGGHSNLTYLVRYGNHEFVLRRPPLGPVAPTAHDMPREYNLLAVIHPYFGLAPKPILLCEDPSVIGAPFYLMERRKGLIVRQTLPRGLNDPDARRCLSEAVVDTLVDLHAVDIYSSDIVKIGKPAGLVERQVKGWSERWQRSKTEAVDSMERVIDWLKEGLPAESDNKDATIVHNDFKLDNLMLAVDDPAHVIAVLDWEMTTVGDPLIDLGLLLTYWTMRGPNENEQNRSLTAVTNGPGWFTREEILTRYEGETGRDLSHISFYEVFARFKIAVVVQQIYFRYVKGQTQDERFRNLGVLVKQLASEALERTV